MPLISFLAPRSFYIDCDREIEGYLARLDSKAKDKALLPSKPETPAETHPVFDLRSHLYRMSAVDFTQMDGLDALSIYNILSRVVLDPRAFPTVKHFTSCLAFFKTSGLLEGS